MNLNIKISTTSARYIALSAKVLPIFLISHFVESAPVLNNVQVGQAVVSQVSQSTTITQQSSSVTIHWDSFNIGNTEAVLFNQPSSNAIAINTILDQNPSQVLGSITANGRIVLLNPNGFYFGRNSSVSANTFIAAATSLANATYDYATNTLSLNASASLADIELQGIITTANKTQLIARTITFNQTSSTTSAQSILITATKDIAIHGAIATTAIVGDVDLFAHGSIVGGGSITSGESISVTTNYLSLTGAYSTNSNATSTISLSAHSILLNNQVTISTANFKLQSTNFALISATINALTQYYQADSSLIFLSAKLFADQILAQENSGLSLLGTITIGDFKTPTVSIDSTTTISANSTTATGGTILIQAKQEANIDGTITTTSIYGNGGFIELSAKQINQSSNLKISTLSTYGNNGTILIDPDYIFISENSSTDYFTDLYQRLGMTLTNGSQFGYSVAIDDNHLIIGGKRTVTTTSEVDTSPECFDENLWAYICPPIITSTPTGIVAFLFRLNNRSWLDLSATPSQPFPTDEAFESPVSVALNSHYALIGLPGISSYRGNAYLYKLDGTLSFSSSCATTSGTLTSAWCSLSSSSNQPITAIAANSWFGYRVALNSTYALIGAPDIASYRGNAYLYKLDGTNGFTSTCATTGNLISAWCTLSSSSNQPITTLAANSYFGVSVALNSTYALIGARGISSFRGNAYLYKLDGTNGFTSTCATTSGTPTSAWCSLSSSINQPITALTANSDFGRAVALNSTHAIIGAYGVSTYRGNAYLYKLDGNEGFTSTCATTGNLISAWCTLSSSSNQPITALAANSEFGRSVALNSTHALVGANGVSSYRGDAYLYKIDGTPSFSSSCATTSVTLTSPWCTLSTVSGLSITALAANSKFGSSVALSNSHALIAASELVAMNVVSVSGKAFLLDLDWLEDQDTIYHTPAQIVNLLNGGNLVLEADKKITVDSPINYSGPNSLTLKSGTNSITTGEIVLASSITFTHNNSGVRLDATGNIIATTSAHKILASIVTLISSNGSIGSTAIPIIIERPTLTWSTSNLNLTAQSGSIYIKTPTSGALSTLTTASPSISFLSSGTFSLEQTIGNISNATNSNTNLSNSNLILRASDTSTSNGNITLNTIPSTASLSLTVAGNLSITSTGSIGSANSPVTIERISGGWSNTNLILSATVGSIYLKTSSVGVLSAFSTISFLSSGTFSLEQTSGNIRITSNINFPSANLILKSFSTDPTYGYIANNSSSYTITISSLTLESYRDIGTSAIPINIANGSGSWTTSNLTISGTSVNIYIKTPTSGVLSALTAASPTISFLSSGTFSLEQTIGNISNATNSNTNLSNSNLILRASDTSTSNGNITLNTIPSTASLSLTVAGNLSITNSTGSIGSSSAPIFIERASGSWTTSNLTISGTSVNIYIKTPTSGVLSALTAASPTISFLSSGTFSLEQTIGNISNATNSNTNLSNSNLILRASDTSTSNGNITLNTIPSTASLSLTVAGNLSITNSTGSIGSSSAPIFIERTSGSWSSSNLSLTTMSSGNIYLKTSVSGGFGATINTFSTGTFSLDQTAGNLSLSSTLNFSSATIILKASDTSSGNGNIVITSNNNITASSITLTANGNITSGTGTLSVGSIGTLTLTATNGSIGTSTNPITITSTSGSWTSSSLNLTSLSSGSIYLKSVSSALFLATINNFLSGTLSFEQTAGNLSLSSTLNFPSATIILKALGASANLNYGTYNITASSITLTAGGNITGGTGTISVGSSGILTLIATNGSIGTSTNPIT
ncbi:MAG: filamentous hemagglutinin N-terminal domain-containing protein, partial [Methylacidiphilales bacterium]|nr:filamentous hemagglutinin N-terminal domain-containing protein [Candidatus Methylacidiphilales bacterium]